MLCIWSPFLKSWIRPCSQILDIGHVSLLCKQLNFVLSIGPFLRIDFCTFLTMEHDHEGNFLDHPWIFPDVCYLLFPTYIAPAMTRLKTAFSLQCLALSF